MAGNYTDYLGLSNQLYLVTHGSTPFSELIEEYHRLGADGGEAFYEYLRAEMLASEYNVIYCAQKVDGEYTEVAKFFQWRRDRVLAYCAKKTKDWRRIAAGTSRKRQKPQPTIFVKQVALLYTYLDYVQALPRRLESEKDVREYYGRLNRDNNFEHSGKSVYIFVCLFKRDPREIIGDSETGERTQNGKIADLKVVLAELTRRGETKAILKAERDLHAAQAIKVKRK